MGRRLRANNNMVLDRIHIYGGYMYRNGMLGHLDQHILGIRGAEKMALVVGILIITVIIWWPRKDGGA